MKNYNGIPLKLTNDNVELSEVSNGSFSVFPL